MLSTAPAAVVEPKEKSKNPGAKAKRMKRLRSNPDFVEGVSEERAAAQMWEDRHADLHRKYKAMMDERLSCQREVIDTEELKNEYIAQLKDNKKLIKLMEIQNSTVKMQDEVIEGLQKTNQDLMEILQLDKRARNPNRLTGNKRGRPQGSKSKAVAFGAEAMPDHDLVTFGTTEEFEAALM